MKSSIEFSMSFCLSDLRKVVREGVCPITEDGILIPPVTKAVVPFGREGLRMVVVWQDNQDFVAHSDVDPDLGAVVLLDIV